MVPGTRLVEEFCGCVHSLSPTCAVLSGSDHSKEGSESSGSRHLSCGMRVEWHQLGPTNVIHCQLFPKLFAMLSMLNKGNCFFLSNILYLTILIYLSTATILFIFIFCYFFLVYICCLAVLTKAQPPHYWSQQCVWHYDNFMHTHFPWFASLSCQRLWAVIKSVRNGYCVVRILNGQII